MRGRLAALLLAGAACAGAATPPAGAAASAPAASAASGPMTEARVAAAVQAIRAEAETGATQRVRRLHWISDESKKKTPPPSGELPGWMTWLLDFARFLSDTSRLLVWVGGILLVAVFGVAGRHLWISRREARTLQAVSPVSHVRDLDVRPESLPDDVGAAAWALWQAGQAQPALALLYRGALSRLIHRHAVPVDAASTEGECLALARGHAGPAPQAYFGRLVPAWQAARYGGHAPAAEQVQALCAGFGPGLEGPPRAATAGVAA